MTSGIYCYCDTENNDEIVYIGQSIHMERRNKEHYRPTLRGDQPINKVLQHNPKRYKFKIMEECEVSDLNKFEKKMISKYNPRFNFGKAVNNHPSKFNNQNNQLLIKLDDEVLKKAKIIADLKDFSLERYLNEVISNEVNSVLSDEELKILKQL